MTISLNGEEVGKKIAESIPGSVVISDRTSVVVDSKYLHTVAEWLKQSDEFDFNYLSFLTCVDYLEYFEVVYRLVSLNRNHSLLLKTRCHTRETPIIPSVVDTWRAADYQEREVFDLFGIKFEDHPNMRRLLLWEGFEGYPLRKDYL